METVRRQISSPSAWSTSLLIIGAFQSWSYIMLYEDLQFQCLKLLVYYYGSQCRTYVAESIDYIHEITNYTDILRKVMDSTTHIQQDYVAHTAIKLELIAHIASLINVTSTRSLQRIIPGQLQRGINRLFHGLCQAEENLSTADMWDRHQVVIRGTFRIIDILQTTADKLRNACRQWIQSAPSEVIHNLPRNIRDVLLNDSQDESDINLVD